MFRRIWTLLRGQSNFELLGGIINSSEGRAVFLGEKKIVSLDPGSIRRDAGRIAKYAESQDYEAFAKEAWLDVLDAIDQLAKPGLSEREVDFHRGALAQTLNLLKISFKAHYKLRELKDTRI